MLYDKHVISIFAKKTCYTFFPNEYLRKKNIE